MPEINANHLLGIIYRLAIQISNHAAVGPGECNPDLMLSQVDELRAFASELAPAVAKMVQKAA